MVILDEWNSWIYEWPKLNGREQKFNEFRTKKKIDSKNKKKLNLHSQIVTHNVAICGLQQVNVKSLDHHIKWTNK